MHAIFVNLTASLLLLQAVSGWCWESPAGCEESGPKCLTATAGACGDFCGHVPERTPASESEEPCDCALECNGVCTYTLSEHVPSERLSKAWASAVAVLVVNSPASVQASFAAHGHALQRPIRPSPQRLHLLHQVILI